MSFPMSRRRGGGGRSKATQTTRFFSLSHLFRIDTKKTSYLTLNELACLRIN